jgi:transmembrane sensor
MMTDPSDVDVQAGHWFARMRAVDAENDRVAFDQWRTADPRHARAYAEIEEIWALTGSVTRGRFVHRSPVRPASGRVRRLWPVLLAASLVALLPIGAMVITRHHTTPALAITVSAADTTRMFRLRDGSIVTLDRHSRMAVDLSGATRRVVLEEGRARFIVAHDPLHPFIVSAADHQVVARGTVFDVAMQGGQTRVTLIDGSVDVSAAPASDKAKAVRLTPGQTLTAHDGQILIGGSRAHDAAWAHARIAFENRPLAEVVGVANRLGGIPIRLGDPHCASLRITGVFDVQDTVALARKLAVTFDLAVTSSASEVLLTSKPVPPN